jgi:acyl-CoA thioesterase-2
MTATTLLEALQLRRTAEFEFEADSIAHDSGRPVVEGGQMIAQTMVAASSALGDRPIRSISAVFARAGATDTPLSLHIEPLHDGRTLASASALVSQHGRALCQAVVLLDRGDPDLIRHAEPFREAGDSDDATPWTTNAAGSEVRIAGGVDMTIPENNGPANLAVWFRVPEAPSDRPVTGQALAAARSHLFLIAAAMRPHEGIGVGSAHETISTGVLTHTISFHEPIDASTWLLIRQDSTYAGHGRAYGRGAIHSRDGHLLASFVQDSMIRAFDPSFARRGKETMVL